MPAHPTGSRRLDGRVHFGRRLRHWRKSAALTQAELGRLLMYDHSYISRMESGSRWPPREVAERCDDLLGAGRELVELWAVADREGRAEGEQAGPPTPGSDGDRAGTVTVEQHRRRLLDWIAVAPPPLLRRLMELEADR
jgi:transcriptional regulator with XRE-family HTH domain